MKYSIAEYAKALAEALADENNAGRQQQIADNFLKILRESGDIAYGRRIILLARDLYCRNVGGKNIVLETARPVNLEKIRQHIAREKDMVSESLNPELIAGIAIIIDGERQLDFSLRKKLEQAFSNT